MNSSLRLERSSPASCLLSCTYSSLRWGPVYCTFSTLPRYHHQVVWIVPSFWNLLPICDYMQPSPSWLTISLLKVPVPCLSLSSAYPGARYTAGNNEFLRSKCETDSFFSRKGEDLGRPEHRTKKNTWFMFWITPSIWGKIHKTH